MNGNNKTPLISVIVPIYNTKEYVGECIESLLNQDIDDFELILVDDGSTDGSGLICDEYEKRDKRIRVFHQTNGGVTSARRLGVEESCGKWICFVDSDDTVTEDYLSKMVGASDDVSIVLAMEEEDAIISARDFRRKCIYMKCDVGPCRKLFKRELFSGNIFNINKKITLGEDMLMNIKLSYNDKIDKIRVIKDKIYNYRYRAESASNSCSYRKEYIDSFLKEYINTIALDDREVYARGILKYLFYLLCNIIRANNYTIKDKKETFNVLKNIIDDFKYITKIKNIDYVSKIYLLYLNPRILEIYLNIK